MTENTVTLALRRASLPEATLQSHTAIWNNRRLIFKSLRDRGWH